MSSIQFTGTPPASMGGNSDRATKHTNRAASMTRSASVSSTSSRNSIASSGPAADSEASLQSSRNGGEFQGNSVEAALETQGYYGCGWNDLPSGLQAAVARSAEPITVPRGQEKIPASHKASKGPQYSADSLNRKLSLDSGLIQLGPGLTYVRRELKEPASASRDAVHFIFFAAIVPSAVYLMYLNKSIPRPSHNELLETSSLQNAYTVFKKELLNSPSSDNVDLHAELEILRNACDTAQTGA